MALKKSLEGSITITSPPAYRTFQRDSADQADIPVSGAYAGLADCEAFLYMDYSEDVAESVLENSGKALALDPRLVEVNQRLADLYKQLGLLSDAMMQFETVAAFFHREGKTREALAAEQVLGALWELLRGVQAADEAAEAVGRKRRAG